MGPNATTGPSTTPRAASTLQTQPVLLAAYHHILTAEYNGPLKVQSRQANESIDIAPPWRYVQVIFFNCI